MTYRHANLRNLNYSEYLAHLPWVLLTPNHTLNPPCHRRPSGYAEPATPCKAAARLIYMSTDGTLSYFCHHHLTTAMDPDWLGDDHPEVRREREWYRKHLRGAYTEEMMPLEEVDYLRHLKVDEKRCDVDPNDLDLDEAGR